MSTKMKCLGAVSAVLAWSGTLFAETRTWVGPTTANTPETAYAWSDAANWQNAEGVAGVPASKDDVVFPNLTAAVYVRLPDSPVEVGRFTAGTGTGMLRLIGEGSFAYGTGTLGGGNFPWFFTACVNGYKGGLVYTAGVHVAGPWTDGSSIISSWSDTNHRLDRYATSSNPLRTDDFPISYQLFPGSGCHNVYGPQSSATNMVSTWSQTAGSPFLTAAAAVRHALPVGTLVTGVGIPEGTYLKRYFDETHLELSAAVTETHSDNALTFAAFTPDVRIHFASFARQGSTTVHTYLFKYRPEDTLRFEFDDFNINNGSVGQNNQLGIASNSSYYPGTYVFHGVTSNNGLVEFLNAHLELAGTVSGGPTVFNDKVVTRFKASDSKVRLTVTNNVVGTIANLTNFVGTLTKDGAGTLNLALADSSSSGTLVVEGGTVTLSARPNGAENAERRSLKSLSLSADSTLVLSNGLTLVVSDVTAVKGAKLSGAGVLRVVHGGSPDLVLENGAKLQLIPDDAQAMLEAPEGEIVGHPAFWLDASKPETLTFTEVNGQNRVTRWNDCRAGEPMFCTNMSARPLFVNGETMDEKYVKIEFVNTNYLNGTQTLVWSDPIYDVRAVFLVENPVDGGGQLLGRCSWRLGNQYYASRGGPFYRDANSNWKSSIVANSIYGSLPVMNGDFFLNGERVKGTKSGYLGPFTQVIEFHSNTNYWANEANRIHGIACDNFGCSYQDVHDASWIRDHNGYQRISECLIYTNSLTYAERAKIAQYLLKKWTGKNISVQDELSVGLAQAGSCDASIEVGAQGVVPLTSLTGNGTVTKTGAGTLYVRQSLNGKLDVREGTAIVRSLTMNGAKDLKLFTEDKPWLHLDADDDDAFVLNPLNGTNFVTRWWNESNSVTNYYVRQVHDSNPLKPTRVVDETTGRRMVDTGPVGSSRGLIMYDDRIATWIGRSSSNNERNGSTNPHTVRSAFIAYSAGRPDGERYGGALLGSYYGSHPQYGFPCYQNTNAELGGRYNPETRYMICNEVHNWGWIELKSWHNDSSADFRLNGMRINPFTTPFTRTTEVFTFRGNQTGSTRKTVTLACQGYDDEGVSGGLKYGEVILTTNRIDDAARENIENYLRVKWRGETIPGFSRATFDSIAVAEGAVLEQRGEGGFVTASLEGGGRIRGDVTTAADATFAVDATEGVPCLAVDGVLDLSAGGMLAIDGLGEALADDLYPIATAEDLVFSAENWTVPSMKGRSLRLVVSGNTLSLRVTRNGTYLIFR